MDKFLKWLETSLATVNGYLADYILVILLIGVGLFFTISAITFAAFTPASSAVFEYIILIISFTLPFILFGVFFNYSFHLVKLLLHIGNELKLISCSVKILSGS